MKIRATLPVLALGLCACQNMPEPYAPPVQRQPFVDYHPHTVRLLNMSDPDAPLHFVQDISPGPVEGSWRWTQKRPTIKLRLGINAGLKYTIDFVLPDATFKDTGPVTISFYVNDHLLDRVRYTTFGEKHFEKPVPPDWVTPDEQTTVAAETDKLWVSKQDGAQLGFILTRMGLTK